MRARPARLVLLGHPVIHSLSPRFQNAALAAAGIPLTYRAIDVPPGALDDTLRRLRDEGAAGNVTIPHKRRAAAICDLLTPAAARAAAVNTFWVEDGRMVGDNTDIGGFAAAAAALLGAEGGSPGGESDARLAGARIALLGAGGAAYAVLAAAERWPGASVRLFNRTRKHAERAGSAFPGLVELAESSAAAARGASLVVNATSVGLHDDQHPMALAELEADTAVLDVVYRPGETAWVRAARARGHRATDGLPMLIEQGALAFERWFGVTPDREVMRDALR